MKIWLTWLSIASLAMILVIGVLRLSIASSSANSAASGRTARMFVTGYTSCDASIRAVKQCDGITASGRKAAPGTVACGPSYPFGTVFEIVGVGRMTCWDRGGGIKDHMLDVWFPDVPTAIRAGISAKWMEVIIYTGAPPDSPATTPAMSQDNATAAMRSGRGSLAAAPAAPAQVQVAAAQPQTAKAAPQPRATTAPALPPSSPKIGGPGGTSVQVQVAGQAPPQADIIGRLDGPANRRADGESSLGNLVADMLRTQFSAHIGLVANRDLRADLPAGSLAATQVSAAFAFDRRAVTQDLRGGTLRQAIEHSLSRLDGWEGFLHVSGLRIGYNPAAPVGQRLTRFELANGSPVVDNAWYRVALTDGVYFGPGYTPILEAGKGLISYQLLSELAVNSLKQAGSLRPPLDGRLAVYR